MARKTCEFIMLCGLPGSGKTTWAKKYISSNAHYSLLSIDDIRTEHFNRLRTEIDKFSSMMVPAIQNKIFSILSDGSSLIYDAVNYKQEARKDLLSFVPEHANKKIIVFLTPLSMCIERVNNRENTMVVDESSIAGILNGFEFPCASEGWDEVIVEFTQDRSSGEQDYIDLFVEMNNMLHLNSFYRMNVGEHSYRVGEVLKRIAEKYQPEQAYWFTSLGYLHDLGKLYTQTYYKNHTIQDNALYPGHENVSAYLSMWYDTEELTLDQRYTRALVINYYDCFNFNEEIVKERAPEVLEYIKLLHRVNICNA